jgi:cytochrome b561
MGNDSGASAHVNTGRESYGTGAIAFHWIMVLLIVTVGILGLLHDSWPKRTQAFWINIHALFGLLVWILVMARFWWRSRHPPPILPEEIGDFARRLAGGVHGLLYALMFVVPIIGIVTFVWHGRAFDFGLFRLNFGIRANRAIFHPSEDIHGYLAYALFALAGLHVVVALWHHFIRRDGVLMRMWPRSGAGEVSSDEH